MAMSIRELRTVDSVGGESAVRFVASRALAESVSAVRHAVANATSPAIEVTACTTTSQSFLM